jgi:hypothetical protein
MPIVRQSVKSSSSASERQEVRTASGTRPVAREPAKAATRAGFPEEEVPTGRLGDTQLRKLVERSAEHEVSAPTLPVAIPLSTLGALAAAAPRAAEVRAAPVVILGESENDSPEIEVVGELEEASIPLVARTPPRSWAERSPRVPVGEPIDFAKNVLGHGYVRRRLVGLALLVCLVLSAAWTATGR